jgi:cell division protease FtsH
MVGRWGMSSAIGPVAVLPVDGRRTFLPGAWETSEQTQRLVDEEVRKLVERAHAEVTTLLREERRRLDTLARELVERETLDEADAYRAAGIEHPDERETPRAAAPAG